jgi:hypothetical protein
VYTRRGTLDLRLPRGILGIAILAMLSAGSGSAFDPEESTNPLVTKFLAATKLQQDALRGTQMEVDIDAQLPKLKESGKMKVLRKVSRLGEITFRTLGEFVGDRTVQHEVIARYLSLENENSANPSIAITPANYKFRLKTKMTQGDSRTYVFELTPKKKNLGLFKGELWVDAATGMPLRESGSLVKSPSIFIKGISFVNEFKLEDGVSLPSHIECHVETHIAGRADLNLRFSHVAPVAEEDHAQAQIADAP